MKLVDMSCPHCGARVKVDINLRSCTCTSCGSPFLIDNEVQHVRYENAAEAGYQFEKGRQLAKAEAMIRNSTAASAVKAAAESSPAKRWLWIIGWLLIFPLPLTILMRRKTYMDPEARVGITVGAWVIYVVGILWIISLFK